MTEFGIIDLETPGSFTKHLIMLQPIQPPIQWVTGALSLGLKRPGA
jgi:hypothetical protein